MNRRHTAKTLGVLALTGALLAGCSGGGDTETESTTAPAPDGAAGTLRVNWGGTPQSWAPGASTETGYMRVPYETLVVLGDDYEVLPNLATEWTEEPMSVTLTLRDDVVFHDGEPFNAEAVKANLEYIRDNPGQYSGPLQAVESVEVIDEYTAQINLAFPSPSFMTMLTQRNVFIASPAAIADGSVVQQPVGTGPWAFNSDESIDGTRWVFDITDDYWGEEPGYATIELYGIADDTAATAALLGNELDLTDLVEDQMPRVESASNIDTLTYPAVRNNIVFFDRAPGGAFGEVDVRKAMCLAIDHQQLDALPNTSYFDLPEQHFVEGEPGYNPDIVGYPVDLDEAADLLGDETVDVVFPSTTFLASQIAFMADQMNQLDGVELTVQDLPVPEYISTWNSGRYALGIGQNNQMTPYDWYSSWFAESARANPAGYESDELKAAAQAAIAAGNSEEADALWQEVMRIIIDEEALACEFGIGGQILGWNADNVAGVAPPHEPYEVNMVNYRDLYPLNAG